MTQLGRGAVVTLTANSSNIVDAITAGMTAATHTVIEDAVGGIGADTMIGGIEANMLNAITGVFGQGCSCAGQMAFCGAALAILRVDGGVIKRKILRFGAGGGGHGIADQA